MRLENCAGFACATKLCKSENYTILASCRQILLRAKSMSRYSASLPVLLDEPALHCYMCAREIAVLGLIGVESLPRMWRSGSLCERRYKQMIVSQVVCFDCFGFQPWPAILAHMVYFTNRRQFFLRQKDSHFMTTWNEARLTYEKSANAHQEFWARRYRARRAREARSNESLRVKLLRKKLGGGGSDRQIEYLDEN